MEPPVQHPTTTAAPVLRGVHGVATVLRPQGPLTRAAVDQLRLAIQTEFAFGTRPIICDLSRAPTIDASSVGMLHEAAQRCGGWPVVHLVFAGARPGVARRLRRSGASRFLVVRDTLEQAERDVYSRPPKLRARVDLPPGLRAMVDARVFVGDCCLRWRISDLLGPASEATTDVLRVAADLGAGSVQLTVDWDGRALSLELLLRGGGPLSPEEPVPPLVRVGHDDRGLTVSASVRDDPAGWADPH